MPEEAYLYLASGSPRRRELLAQIAVAYKTLDVAVDETPLDREKPADYVVRVALAKARAGWEALGKLPPRPVLGADTAVVVDGMILGKPKNRTEGLRMLFSLSGREHQVLSAVALVQGEREATRVQTSRVRFRALSSAECEAYWDTGEPFGKAGAYAIQGRAAAFIMSLSLIHI